MLVVINTPALSCHPEEGPHERGSSSNLARAETLLLLSASMKEGDLAAAKGRAEIFREAGLIVTKLDETEALGSLAGFILSQSPRLAFFSMSPKTSEDFVPASSAVFMDQWLRKASRRA